VNKKAAGLLQRLLNSLGKLQFAQFLRQLRLIVQRSSRFNWLFNWLDIYWR